MDPRGRSCPLAYRYQPEALAQPGQLEADTLCVVGGLCGNPAALQAVLDRAAAGPGGPATIVFNGDFHWLDVDPEDFEEIGAAGLPAFAGTTYGVMTRRCGRRRWRGPRPRV